MSCNSFNSNISTDQTKYSLKSENSYDVDSLAFRSIYGNNCTTYIRDWNFLDLYVLHLTYGNNTVWVFRVEQKIHFYKAYFCQSNSSILQLDILSANRVSATFDSDNGKFKLYSLPHSCRSIVSLCQIALFPDMCGSFECFVIHISVLNLWASQSVHELERQIIKIKEIVIVLILINNPIFKCNVCLLNLSNIQYLIIHKCYHITINQFSLISDNVFIFSELWTTTSA